MDAEWQWQRQQIRSLVAAGQPIEAMKAIMQEMRRFSTVHDVAAMSIDTSEYYKNPAGVGHAMQALGTAEHIVAHFAGILAERGAIFMVLGQPMRALPDLEAAVEIYPTQDQSTLRAFEDAKAQTAVTREAERKALERRKVPVTVLTGFLGAGKTTLLNYILRSHHGKRYAVIENEVGKIGIDNQLLEGAGMATKTQELITLLDNGCLCCTVRTDLINAVSQILDQAEAQAINLRAVAASNAPAEGAPPLDAILIETTGLADPGPVCKTFYVEEQLRLRTRLDGVLTVVDAVHFLEQLSRRRSDGSVNESAQQIAFADTILLNKTDVVDATALEKVDREIRAINSVVHTIHCSLAKRPQEVPLDELLGREGFSLDRILADLEVESRTDCQPAVKRRRGGATSFSLAGVPTLFSLAGDQQSRHDSAVRSCAFTLEGAPLVLERFMQVMNTIRAENALDLYRYKGAVCVKESSGVLKRAVLQGVHDMCEFQPRGQWPSDTPPKSQLVFIGRNLKEDIWRSLFEKTKEGVLDE